MALLFSGTFIRCRPAFEYFTLKLGYSAAIIWRNSVCTKH